MPQSHIRPTCVRAGLVVAMLACAGSAVAASQRTFVATTGIDNLVCSLVAPCRSFAAAIAATSPSGEVIVRDSGGYGTVTITKSVSIIAPPGVYAGISVFSGSGITITTPATTDKVVLQGLAINNLSPVSFGNGIHFAGAGRLEVVRTRISGFGGSSGGLLFLPATGGQGSLHAVDLTVTDNNYGIAIGSQFAGTAVAVLERIEASANYYGIAVTAPADVVIIDSAVTQNVDGFITFGVMGSVALVTLDRCNVSRNRDYGVFFSAGPGTTYATITASTIAHNGVVGLEAGAFSTARLAGSTIAQNLIGIEINGGTVESQGNNFIYGNTTDGPAPTVVGSK